MKKTGLHHFLLIFILLLLSPFVLMAEGEEEGVSNSITLSGVVKDMDGEPLYLALVYLHETLNSSTTDKNGVFKIQNVSPGNYHLHIQYLGFEAHAKTIVVGQDDVFYTINMRTSDLNISEVLVESRILKRKAEEKSLTLTVLTSDELRRKPGTTLIDALEHIPGVNSISTGTQIAKPVIRGLGFNRIQLNENGIRQEGQQWGEEHGIEIDRFAVERVEVIKGPGSLIYGSDAMGGVINISPKTYPNQNFVRAGFDAVGKSNNQLLGTSAHVHYQKDRKFLFFRATALDYADFIVPADSFHYNRYIFALPDGRIKNTAGQEYAFTGRAGISGEFGSTMLQFSYINQNIGFFPGAIGVPRAYLLQPDANRRSIDIPRQEIEHLKLTINNTILFRNNWLDIDFGYQRNQRRELSFPHAHGFGPRPEGNLALEMDLHTYSLNTRYHHYWNQQTQSIAGISAQYQHNAIDGFEFLIPAYESFHAGAFLYNEWKPSDQWILNGGVRYDFGLTDISAYNEPIYETPEIISGYYQRAPDTTRYFHQFSAGLGFSYLHTDNWNFKFNFGRSFKMPSIAEIASNGVHHSTFRHEKGSVDMDVETGYQFDVTASYSNQRFNAMLTPFLNYFDNYIYLRPSGQFSFLPHSGQLYRYHQADALHVGGEFLMEYSIIRERLNAGLSMEYVYGLNLEDNFPLPFTPPFTTRFDLNYGQQINHQLFHRFDTRAEFRYSAPQNFVERNELKTPGFYTVAFGLGTDLNIGKQSVSLYFSIENLLDTKYYNHLSYYRMLNLPEQGRNFSLQLSVPLNWNLD